MTDTIHPQPELSDDELLRVYGLAKRDHNYEGSINDWPKLAERAATVAGLRAAIAADRARAALAQPEPEGPTEQEWDALVESAWDKHRTVGYHGERFIYEGDFDTALGFVREELARWGNHPGSPDSSGNLKTGLTGSPADGEVVELVVALRADAECVEVEHYDLCNMTADQMRRAADLLERLSPPQPVPVSERLPDNRDPECVANWPECWSGGYDPRCCRFPKSCSCERGALPLPVEVEG